MTENTNSNYKTNADIKSESMNGAPEYDNFKNFDGIKIGNIPSSSPRCAPGMNGWGAMFTCPKWDKDLPRSGYTATFPDPKSSINRKTIIYFNKYHQAGGI